MYKIIITSTKFSGSLEFEMEADEVVRKFTNHADMDETILNWLSSHFPLTLAHINELVSKSKTLKAELISDVTFENFWNLYPLKRNKARAERWWNRLKDAERTQALKNLKPYLAFLERNTQQAMMYPDTYLNPNERRFENEYH